MGRVLDGSEVSIHDIVISDYKEAGGDEINYYSTDKQASTVDPVYGEYSDRHIDGPWNLPAIFKWPQQNPAVGDAGYTVEFDGKCYISRFHFEDKNAPYPIENDVIEAWRTPYHDEDSMGKGLFFDIIQVNNKGHINDSAVFVEFELILKRRPQYSAERRIIKP